MFELAWLDLFSHPQCEGVTLNWRHLDALEALRGSMSEGFVYVWGCTHLVVAKSCSVNRFCSQPTCYQAEFFQRQADWFLLCGCVYGVGWGCLLWPPSVRSPVPSAWSAGVLLSFAL